jgi:hypothetical protein
MQRDPTRPELSTEERILLAYLHKHCRGAAYARTYGRLRQDLEAAGVKIAEREMYELVSSLALKGRPVGTVSAGSGGAFIVCDARDARLAYRNLYGRVCRQFRRCKAFKRTCREVLGHQQFLDVAEKVAEAKAGVGNSRTAKAPPSDQQGSLFGNITRGSRT